MLEFKLVLSYEQYRDYYTGTIKTIQVESKDGKQIRFPASVLKPYLQQSGIRGHFAIWFDDRNRFERIEKLS